MPNIRQFLETRVSAAIAAAWPDAADAPAIVQAAADGRFGDYQANGAMALAKRLKTNPHEVAQRVVEQLNEDAEVAAMAETPEIAGPGFINFTLRPEWVAERLGEVNHVDTDGEDRLGVEPAAEPETVVVDYSAPNLAKEMHVGHLRSTIIGDALVRMLDFAGHNVVRQNHVGDWGTQVGMLIEYLFSRVASESTAEFASYVNLLLSDLEEFYRQAKTAFDTSQRFAAAARQAVVRLQSGEADALERWQGWRNASLAHSFSVYKRLGVLLTTDDIRGESAYNDVLSDIVDALQAKGLLTESEGARCVFLQDADGKPLFANKEGEPLPLIVQKADEGYLYATTDLAAIAFRTGCLPEIPNPKSQIRNENSPKASRILYVVDARQSLHFQMVFECAYQAGFAEPGRHALVHVAFGTMMGEDGRPFKTREGGTVKLMDLLDEAERRARKLVEEKQADLPDDQPHLSEEEKDRIARKVGIGGVKYADLSQNRTSD
ncbi:MAG: arginine--tRNA ligase, partial [Planctomycetota bacterium]|nr:arginine--tRNA ligase [Planctomycetota bacterium]